MFDRDLNTFVLMFLYFMIVSNILEKIFCNIGKHCNRYEHLHQSGQARSRGSQMLFKIGVLKHFVMRSATLLKRDSNTDVFLWILRKTLLKNDSNPSAFPWKFLRRAFFLFMEHLRWLLLVKCIKMEEGSCDVADYLHYRLFFLV